MEAKPQIFISYASEDRDKVRRLFERLSRAGFKPWLDEESILPGEYWRSSIRRAIRSADFFLACLSKHSTDSGFLSQEIKYALENWNERLEGDIYLIPIRLEECEVPEPLRHFQWVDLFAKNGWRSLLRALEAGMTRREEGDARLLESCADITAIASVHRHLATTELEGPVSSLLRSFSRFSKDVGAALQQETAYNQRLALSAVEDRIDSLLRELFRSGEDYAKRYRLIADKWRRIVADRLYELTGTAEQRQEIDSPYVIGVPLTEKQEIFVGRKDVGLRIEQLLLDRRRPPLLLYGQRRMGKTSLLNNLGRLLPSTIIPLFVDLQGPASQASNHAGLLYNIARAMTASADRQRHLTFPALTREVLEADPFTAFDEWLDEVEGILEKNIALLMLDEFEALDDALARGHFSEAAVLGMLRHLIQHRQRFKVLLAGSHTLEELQRWSSYLINVQVVKLDYLKESDARKLIEHPVSDFALRYEPEASQRVLDLTRGHPFLVQLLCAEIVALKNEQKPAARRLARLADVEAAVPEALSHGSFFFADIQRNQLDPASLALLRFMAAQGERIVVSRQTLMQQFPDGLNQRLAPLLVRDLIESADGGYRFQVELIRRSFAEEHG